MLSSWGFYTYNGSAWQQLANTAALDGNWHFLTWSGDGSQVRFYVDNQEKSLTVEFGGNYGQWFSTFGTDTLSIGALNRDSDYGYFKGSIKEVAVFNRVLSPSEREQLYQRGRQGLGVDIASGLQGYWPLQADYNDYSGQGNTGTPQGGMGFSSGGSSVTFAGNPVSWANAPANGKPAFGGSLYFDGSGDSLKVPGSSDLDFGSGDFTIDTWVKLTTPTGTWPGLADRWDYLNNRRIFEFVVYGPTGHLRCYVSPDGSTALYAEGTTNLFDNLWHHVAAVRSGSTLRVFVDGKQEGSVNIGTISLYVNNNVNLYIGRDYDVSYLKGYLDELRISKGIARWTSNFTPEVAPYSPDKETQLLLHLDGDKSLSQQALTMNGSLALDASQGKFDGSFSFNGSSYITIPDIGDFDFASGDFTVDFWAKGLSGENSAVIQTADAGWGPSFGYVRGGEVVLYLSSNCSSSWDIASQVSGGAVPGASEWVHFAVVRSGSNFYLFRNGMIVNQFSSNLAICTPTGSVNIGRYRYTNGSQIGYLNGFVDELRVSKGIARWTSNFTPPTTPYESNAAGSFEHFRGLIDNVSVWDTPRDDGEILDRAMFIRETGYPRAALASPLNDLTFRTGVAIDFDASASTDPAGVNISIPRYFWDFGDGSPMQVTTSPTISHTYTKTGIMTIYVAIEDGDANFDSTSIKLNISSTMTLDAYRHNATVKVRNIQKNQGW
jgi:hypothetical protein